METYGDATMKSKDTLTEYKPSPYSSILPRVQLSKTKPLIEVVDVAPEAVDAGTTENRIREQETNLQTNREAIESPASTQAVPIEHASSSIVEIADGNISNTKFVQVISTSSSTQTSYINTTSARSHNICSTCIKNVARYTCPKCLVPYCSASCYKIHDGIAVDSNNEKICTESFYKHRVLGEYHARGSEEDKLKLCGILNRIHQDIGNNMDNVEWREDSLSKLLQEKETAGLNGLHQHDERLAAASFGDSADQITDDELAEMASYILNLEEEEEQNTDPEMRVQQLKEMMPPQLLNAFECALSSALGSEYKENDGLNLLDERNKQLANATWQPWWLPVIGQCLDTTVSPATTQNLDERILSIQPLPSLISKTNNRNLAYNILDVLYATSFALRTASSARAADSSMDVLLLQSLVLSNNAVYESVSQVLSACSQHYVEMSKTTNPSNDLSWDVLASDVGLISRNRRYVLRMLFEAADIFVYGLNLLKIHVNQLKRNDKIAYEEKKHELDHTKRKYKLVLKKIEYFQSWSSSKWNVDVGQEISEEVESFIEHWRMPEKNEKTSHIESILGNMLNKADPSDAISNDNAFDMLEVPRKEQSFHLGKELRLLQ